MSRPIAGQMLYPDGADRPGSFTITALVSTKGSGVVRGSVSEIETDASGNYDFTLQDGRYKVEFTPEATGEATKILGTAIISGGASADILTVIENSIEPTDTLEDIIESLIGDALPASVIPFTPAGTISADDVQAAIEELDSETQTALSGKSATGHSHTASDVSDFSSAVSQQSDVAEHTSRLSGLSGGKASEAKAKALTNNDSIMTVLRTVDTIRSAGLGITVKAGTTYTLAGDDNGHVLVFNQSSDVTITLPQTSTETIPTTFRAWVWNRGAGQVKFSTQGSDNLAGAVSGRVVRGTLLGMTKLIAGSPNTWGVDGGEVLGLPLKEVAGTSYTVTGDDNGYMLVFTSGSAVTVTLPEQSTEALAAGFEIGLTQKGAGAVSFTTEGTDDLRNVDGHTALEGVNATGHIYLEDDSDPNVWFLSGRTG